MPINLVSSRHITEKFIVEKSRAFLEIKEDIGGVQAFVPLIKFDIAFGEAVCTVVHHLCKFLGR